MLITHLACCNYVSSIKLGLVINLQTIILALKKFMHLRQTKQQQQQPQQQYRGQKAFKNNKFTEGHLNLEECSITLEIDISVLEIPSWV